MNNQVKIYNYSSYEEAAAQYNIIMEVVKRAKELGYSFNYEITQEGVEIKIIIKHAFNLN